MDVILRQSILDTGIEERVETNTRHLIDKILARYSAEFTVFRELIQNSNDAGASDVRIDFQCIPSDSFLNTLPQHCTAITYKNNGRVFRDEDWRRLKSIAEGNPDETKVGFFGVGFYSLFSICEEPFISSGDACLGFYWKGDQLFAKRAQLPETVTDRNWTSFVMQLRDPMDVPNVNIFSKFLATCLSFTEVLVNIDIYLDNQHVISLSKSISPDIPLEIPSTINQSSPKNLFSLNEIELRNVQMSAKLYQQKIEPTNDSLTSKVALWLGVSKPKPPTPAEYTWVACNIFLRVARARINVKSSTQLQTQMERTTKKRIPNSVMLSAVYNTLDEHKLSLELATQSSVFQDLVPFPNQGNIFIGFKTHQTTGCCVHLAGHFIPTVERENLDLVDPTLAFWNQELVSMGGTLIRVLYDTEIIQNANLDTLRYTHIVNGFTCHQSTPASTISQLISRTFFSPSHTELQVLSTRGICPVSKARLYDSDIAQFLVDELAMVSKPVYEGAKVFFDLLVEAQILNHIHTFDVLAALPRRVDDIDRIVCILKWALKSKLSHDELSSLRSRFTFSRFASKRWFSPLAPMPEDVMPHTLCKQLDESSLRNLGFKDLSIPEWAQFVHSTNQFDSPEKCSDILGIFARAVPNLPALQVAQIISGLMEAKCIPTTVGLVKPADAYVSAELFTDLPIINVKLPDRFLKQLGVRDHIDPHILLQRLDSLNWTPEQMIIFFSRESKLDHADLAKIANARIFPGRKAGLKVMNQKYLARDLLLPSPELDSFDVLQLDVDIKPGSREYKLLVQLEMQKALDPLYIIRLASNTSTTIELRFKLLEYAGKHHTMNNSTTAYIPASHSDTQNSIYPASALYTDSQCQVMGFHLLHPRLIPISDKLGVQKTPSVETLIHQLKSGGFTKESIRPVLEYLATRSSEFAQHHFATLSKMSFIPIDDHAHNQKMPSAVFLNPFPLLPHIDYGSKANQFLRLCGVKDEPNPIEMAEWLLKYGASVYSDQPDEYLEVLTKVAFHFASLQNHPSLLKKLAEHPILVGFQGDKQMLVSAKEVYLVDDPVLQNIFSPVTCPMDPTLEHLYEAIGSKWLSTVIDRRYDVQFGIFGQCGDPSSKLARGLKARIDERAPLLVHDLNKNQNIAAGALDKLKAVKINKVYAIHLVREFLGKTHNQTVSAAMANKHTVYITDSVASEVGVVDGVDYFDVARCLSGLIFKRPRLNDQLLLSTLLSTSLDALRIKGFPVDRILKITPKPKEVKRNDIDPAVLTPPSNPPHLSPTSNKTNPKSQNENQPVKPPSYQDATTNPPELPPRPSSETEPLLNNLAPSTPPPSKKSFLNRLTRSSSSQSSLANQPSSSPVPSPSIPSKEPNQNKIKEGTPEFEEYLQATLKEGIRSSSTVKPPGATIKNAPQLAEAQSTFCDLINSGHDLVEITQNFLPVKLYVGRGSNMNQMWDDDGLRGRLIEFAGVLLLIGDVFGLSAESVHIYHDANAESIAFNRGGALFFNSTRYFRGTITSKVYTYWYMIFSHELAHNHIHAHNADHEFYMAAYAGQFMTKFMVVLLELGINLNPNEESRLMIDHAKAQRIAKLTHVRTSEKRLARQQACQFRSKKEEEEEASLITEPSWTIQAVTQQLDNLDFSAKKIGIKAHIDKHHDLSLIGSAHSSAQLVEFDRAKHHDETVKKQLLFKKRQAQRVSAAIADAQVASILGIKSTMRNTEIQYAKDVANIRSLSFSRARLPSASPLTQTFNIQYLTTQSVKPTKKHHQVPIVDYQSTRFHSTLLRGVFPHEVIKASPLKASSSSLHALNEEQKQAAKESLVHNLKKDANKRAEMRGEQAINRLRAKQVHDQVHAALEQARARDWDGRKQAYTQYQSHRQNAAVAAVADQDQLKHAFDAKFPQVSNFVVKNELNQIANNEQVLISCAIKRCAHVAGSVLSPKSPDHNT